MPDQQDIEIVQRLQQGDTSAFDTLYIKYFKLLCASAFFYIRNECEAKDLVQNLFLDIWEKKLYNRFHNDVKGYLFLAVKNRSLNHIKMKVVKDKRHDKYVYYHQEGEEVDEDQYVDYQSQLKEALSSLKGQKRAVIQMVYQNEKKYKQAATEMGISINSLKTHLKSAVKVLRRTIKP